MVMGYKQQHWMMKGQFVDHQKHVEELMKLQVWWGRV
jgi:hypothetical protein